MTLTVEDGTGVTGADSYVSLADARTIAANYALDLDSDDAKAEAQLRNGYLYISNYEVSERLMGFRTHASQTGTFPRPECYLIFTDYPFTELDSQTIPEDVKRAQVIAAHAYNSGMDTYTADTKGRVTEINVQGVYSEKRDVSRVGQYPKVDAVTNILDNYSLTEYNRRAAVVNGEPVNRVYRESMWYNGWRRW